MGPLVASNEKSIFPFLMEIRIKIKISFDVPGPSSILSHTEADTEERNLFLIPSLISYTFFALPFS